MAGAWSPDGTQILTVTYSVDCPDYCEFINYELATVNVSTGQLRRVTNTPYRQESSPVWAPDGDRIFFVADGDVFMLRLSGGDPVNLTNSPDSDDRVSFGPAPRRTGDQSHLTQTRRYR